MTSRILTGSRAFLGILILLAVFLPVGTPVAAAAPVQVISNTVSYVYSEDITFALSAKIDTSVSDVILFYGRDGEPLVRRIYPDFTPGTALDVSYTETLESGQYAPGTRMRFWWRLETESGQQIKLPVQYFDYTDQNHAWQTLSDRQIDLYWYGNAQDEAATLLIDAETTLARIQQEVGITVDERVQVYVYNNQEDMSKSLATRSDDFDARVLTLGVAVDEHTLLLLGSHADVQNTLSHELSHIVVGIATDNPYTGLPRWLDEGLAMYAEGEMPRDNQRAVERGIRNDDLLSIQSMTTYSGRPDQVDLFYGETYSVVDYLLSTYGRDKMRDLLQTFSKGVRQEDALRAVYGFGLQELDSQWRQSLGLAPRQAPATPSANLHSAQLSLAGGALSALLVPADALLDFTSRLAAIVASPASS